MSQVRLEKNLADGIILTATINDHKVAHDFLKFHFPVDSTGKMSTISMTDLIGLKHEYGHRNGTRALGAVDDKCMEQYKTHMNPQELFSLVVRGTKAGGSQIWSESEVQKAFGDKFDVPFESVFEGQAKSKLPAGEKFERSSVLLKRTAPKAVLIKKDKTA